MLYYRVLKSLSVLRVLPLQTTTVIPSRASYGSYVYSTLLYSTNSTSNLRCFCTLPNLLLYEPNELTVAINMPPKPRPKRTTKLL